MQRPDEPPTSLLPAAGISFQSRGVLSLTQLRDLTEEVYDMPMDPPSFPGGQMGAAAASRTETMRAWEEASRARLREMAVLACAEGRACGTPDEWEVAARKRAAQIPIKDPPHIHAAYKQAKSVAQACMAIAHALHVGCTAPHGPMVGHMKFAPSMFYKKGRVEFAHHADKTCAAQAAAASQGKSTYTIFNALMRSPTALKRCLGTGNYKLAGCHASEDCSESDE